MIIIWVNGSEYISAKGRRFASAIVSSEVMDDRRDHPPAVVGPSGRESDDDGMWWWAWTGRIYIYKWMMARVDPDGEGARSKVTV